MPSHRSESMEKAEEEAFLNPERERHRKSRTVRLSTLLYIVSIQAGVMMLGAYIVATRFKPCFGQNCGDSIGYYPASEAISYYETTLKQEKIYKTTDEDLPTQDTDAAWEALQAPTDGVVQISAEMGFDMDRLLPSITCPSDHRLHQYGLSVHHQLHCLDIIRKSYYPEHYFPNSTDFMRKHHREHCIEHLRQSIMCAGDISLDRWTWDKVDKTTYVLTDTPRVCRDFKKLNAWVEKYQFVKDDWKASKFQLPP